MQAAAIVFCLVTLMLAAGSKTAAQTINPCDNLNKLPPTFYEVPPGPQGDWKASYAPELKQIDDPLVPVVVATVSAYQGPGPRGIRFGCSTLKNRSPKLVAAVQLRWTLVKMQDFAVIRQKGFSSDTVLREGHTPAIELSIPRESSRRTDFAILSWVEATKDLARDGILTGDYFLFVGVYEVLFEDGSVWYAGPVKR